MVAYRRLSSFLTLRWFRTSGIKTSSESESAPLGLETVVIARRGYFQFVFPGLHTVWHRQSLITALEHSYEAMTSASDIVSSRDPDREEPFIPHVQAIVRSS